MGDIIIRDLTTYDEFLQVRQVQQACWGFSNAEGLYPPVLLTASQNGGTVLGAFDPQGVPGSGERLVGYLFGFLGLHENRGPLKLCSQTMGVLPDYRGRGIAENLKWAQRDRALKLGLELVTWTYDPLEGPNAYLNLHKLNALVRLYKRNVYGEHFGSLNEGLPTDRFLVEWWVEQISNAKHLHCAQAQVSQISAQPASTRNVKGHEITRVEGSGTAQRLVEIDLKSEDDTVCVEVPVNIQAIRKENLQLARDWRFKTREIFETYFARGYVAVDFTRQDQRNLYTLWRAPAEWLAKLTE